MRAGFTDKTIRMLLDKEDEIFASAVGEGHPYRILSEVIDFIPLVSPIQNLYSRLGTTGYAVEQGYKAMLVQFWEDLSDREMERGLRENLAFRYFCGFGLRDKTPDHSYFGRLRKRIGTKRMADSFNEVCRQLREKGLYGDTFNFIDSSMIVTKVALWDERDRAIKDGYEKLNNQIVSKYAADKDARWGAKSKKKIWFGYKRHSTVDMRYGLIGKTAVTPANVPDFKLMENLCPDQGMVFADKGYDYPEADNQVQANNCQAATIRKKNNQNKIPDLDRWRTRVRMPFEGAYAQLSQRTRYRGEVKVAFQNFIESLVYNLKKAVVIIPKIPPPPPKLQVECVYLSQNSTNNHQTYRINR
jgi:transposase, IS5 family